jgi:hypothetical protein
MNNRINAALLTFTASIALPLLSTLPAVAVTVSIGPNSYDVTAFTGSYNSSSSLFQALPPGQMPWWGDITGDLASEFAKQVYDQLGNGPTSGFGPVFAYDLDMAGIIGLSQSLTDPLSQNVEIIPWDASVSYAATTQPVPSPLPIFGAIAAFGLSRRIRKRINEAN